MCDQEHPVMVNRGREVTMETREFRLRRSLRPIVKTLCSLIDSEPGVGVPVVSTSTRVGSLPDGPGPQRDVVGGPRFDGGPRRCGVLIENFHSSSFPRTSFSVFNEFLHSLNRSK